MNKKTDKAVMLQEHECKAMKSCESLMIKEMHFEGRDRDVWLWLYTHGDRVDCHEIIHCPYCGEHLGEEKPKAQEYAEYYHMQKIMRTEPIPFNVWNEEKLGGVENQ
jgi:hypothetical protein